MDLNNNIKTKRTLDNNISNERDILPHKHAFIFYAYDRDSSPISEGVQHRNDIKQLILS